ncbi:hypothetical protein SAMN05216188_11120 [Lentzea xinjiangensis]|uniref:Uncharacterized protein n=1 Tax=Lentzea xinjiangensis TaxID=402600 RepID=A0A1H9NXH2_9PSEU|nr:hypothetical protein [Lentzea xinjiangensis]SER40033.1 hypothetical protein SAMN05216188_11120 [Lentzea xinjiangensis]
MPVGVPKEIKDHGHRATGADRSPPGRGAVFYCVGTTPGGVPTAPPPYVIALADKGSGPAVARIPGRPGTAAHVPGEILSEGLA